MTAHVLARTRGMPREQWLALRRHGIGSSDAPAVAGVSPWRSPFAVWAEKTGTAVAEDAQAAERLEIGQRLEPVAADLFAARTGYRVRRRYAILQHPDYPWMIADLDRLVWDGAHTVPLELKATQAAWGRAAWEDDPEALPDHIRIQVAHQLAVTDAPYGYVGVLLGTHEYRWTRVPRDPDLEARLVDLEATFWRLVETRVPPTPGAGAATRAALEALWPTPHAEDVPLGIDAESLAARYLALSQYLQRLEADRDAVGNALRAALADATSGHTPQGYRITWRPQTRRTVDLQRLRAEYPDVAAACTVETTTRVLRVTAPPQPKREG